MAQLELQTATEVQACVSKYATFSHGFVNIGKSQLKNGRRGANICQRICSLSHERVNLGTIQFANGHSGANTHQIIGDLSHKVLKRSTIFCDTVEPTFRLYVFYNVVRKFRTLHTWRTHGQTSQGFWAQLSGKPICMRIKCS